MELTAKDITVVITNYNYGQYISHAIDSVMMQYPNTPNLIVIDDKSSDESVLTIKNKEQQWNKKLKGFEIIINEENIGIVATRNKILDMCQETGRDYIIFLDADDALEKNYISAVIDTYNNEPCDVIYTPHVRINEDNEILEHEMHAPPKYNPLRLRTKNYIHVSALQKVSDVRYRDIPMLEDWVYWMEKQKAKETFSRCESTGLYYRRHGASRNTAQGTKLIKTREVIKKILGDYCLGV